MGNYKLPVTTFLKNRAYVRMDFIANHISKFHSKQTDVCSRNLTLQAANKAIFNPFPTFFFISFCSLADIHHMKQGIMLVRVKARIVHPLENFLKTEFYPK